MMKSEFEKFYLSKFPYGRTTLDDVIKNGYQSPYILEERELNCTQLDVFSRLLRDRILFLGVEVTADSCNVINAQLLFLESTDPGKDICMYLNTPGGEVYSGFGVIDTMNYITSDVSTVCTGMAASMGAMLLVSGAKGKRMCLPHSRVMIHQPLGGTRGQASDIEIEAKEILKLKNELYQVISDCSGQPFDKVWKDADRDYWMTAQEAKDYGMIDQIVTRTK